MYHMYNRLAETMPRDELRTLQGSRLIETVKRVYYNVPAYKKKLVRPEYESTA